MRKEDKPMLSIEDQIKHLQSKGVKFSRTNIVEATKYLSENNNYFKLRAYRKNFPKHPDGVNKGQYIDLDFSQLQDLATIDMHMRYVFIQMVLDVEHFAKVQLIKEITQSNDDGYQIVEEYLQSLRRSDRVNKTTRYHNFIGEIKRNDNNPYCGELVRKYEDCYPVWVLVELISFGSFIHFYNFCAKHLNNRSMQNNFYLLLTIKELRNAVAHNNCLINDLTADDKKHELNYQMLRELNSISKSTRNNQLKNERKRQISTLLFSHAKIVTSIGVHEATRDKLIQLKHRMNRNIADYENGSTIASSFGFFSKIIDIWFPEN